MANYRNKAIWGRPGSGVGLGFLKGSVINSSYVPKAGNPYKQCYQTGEMIDLAECLECPLYQKWNGNFTALCKFEYEKLIMAYEESTIYMEERHEASKSFQDWMQEEKDRSEGKYRYISDYLEEQQNYEIEMREDIQTAQEAGGLEYLLDDHGNDDGCDYDEYDNNDDKKDDSEANNNNEGHNKYANESKDISSELPEDSIEDNSGDDLEEDILIKAKDWIS